MLKEVKQSSQQGNATAKEHAKAYRKLKGIPEPEDNDELTDLPGTWLRYGEVILSLFWVINEGRQGGFGINPLTWSDLETWSQLMNLKLRPLEVNLLKVMDMAFLTGYRETQNG